MNTPAYRYPIDTKTKKSNEPSDPALKFKKIKQTFRYGIVHRSIRLIMNYGMLLGGLDRLWKVASDTAGRIAGSPDSFNGRVSRSSTSFLSR